LRNIRRPGCFAVHVVDDRLRRAIEHPARLPTGTNEFEAADHLRPLQRIAARVVQDAPPAWNGELLELIPLAWHHVHHALGQVSW